MVYIYQNIAQNEYRVMFPLQQSFHSPCHKVQSFPFPSFQTRLPRLGPQQNGEKSHKPQLKGKLI